jgi:hypothetical protein
MPLSRFSVGEVEAALDAVAMADPPYLRARRPRGPFLSERTSHESASCDDGILRLQWSRNGARTFLSAAWAGATREGDSKVRDPASRRRQVRAGPTPRGQTRPTHGRSAELQSALGATNGRKLLGMARVKSRLPAGADTCLRRKHDRQAADRRAGAPAVRLGRAGSNAGGGEAPPKPARGRRRVSITESLNSQSSKSSIFN